MTRNARFVTIFMILALLTGVTASVAAAVPGSTEFAAGGAPLPSEDCNFPRGDTTSTPGKPRLLSATINADGTGASYINYSGGCSFEVSLASYQIFEVYAANGTPVMNSQMMFDLASATLGPGQSLTLTIALPSCMAQVDAFFGSVITTFAYGDRYTPRLLSAAIIGDTLCTHASNNGTDTPANWKDHAAS